MDEIVKNSYDHLYLVDFGLSSNSKTVEDKAVDLYVLKRSIISMNVKSQEIVKF